MSDAVNRVASSAAFPEVRAFAKEAAGVLKAAGGDVQADDSKKPTANATDELEDDVLTTIVAKMPEGWAVKPKFELPGRALWLLVWLLFAECGIGQKVQLHPSQRKCLLFAAALGAELVRAGRVRAYDAEKVVWGRCVGTYISGWARGQNTEINGVEEGDAKGTAKGEGWEVAQAVRTHYWDLERVRVSIFPSSHFGVVWLLILLQMGLLWFAHNSG